MKNIYAVVKVSEKTVKSKWFIKEDNKIKDVTAKLFMDVINYNQKKTSFTKIPYCFKNGYVTYAFGCGLTHYLQNTNLKEVTNLDVDNIVIFTTRDFTMFGISKFQKDWHQALEIMLTCRGELNTSDFDVPTILDTVLNKEGNKKGKIIKSLGEGCDLNTCDGQLVLIHWEDETTTKCCLCGMEELSNGKWQLNENIFY